jgi:hypothetical protein
MLDGFFRVLTLQQSVGVVVFLHSAIGSDQVERRDNTGIDQLFVLRLALIAALRVPIHLLEIHLREVDLRKPRIRARVHEGQHVLDERGSRAAEAQGNDSGDESMD